MESNRLLEDGFSAAASASEAAVVACGVEREVIGRDDDAAAIAATVKRQSVNGGSEAEVNLRSRSGSVKGEEQVIRWERFLPRRILRVLLVENDDSTRHIVAALLRKCSYQVAAVADGLKAWDILKERHFNFDLVLTEVVMPSLSGIGLLSKIMSNEICKNIPVIMMSSHDSVGIVFKCMLKGAADFLVKPVRKNELRNLWQHVWRKCSSTNYGNGLENGNLNHMKVEGVSENETASNHGSANDGGRSKTGESSHAGSDTQSSCSKPDTEIGSMQKQGEPLETEKRNFSMEVDSISDEQETDRTEITLLSIPENVIIKDKSKELEIKVTLSIRTALSSEKVNEENASFVRSPYRENDQADMLSKSNENNGPEILDQQKAKDLPSDKVNEFIRTETTQRYGHQFSEDNGIRDDVLCVSSKSFNVNGCYSLSSPLLELSLRRSELNGPDEVSQDKHVLKRSHASAFSRYGKASIHQKPSPLSSVSCIKADDSGSSNCQIRSSADKGQKFPFPSIERSNSSHGIVCEPLGRQLSSGSNKEDVGPSSSFPAGENAGLSSTEKPFSPKPQLGCVPFSIPVGAIPFQSFSGGYGAVLHPAIYTEHLVPESSLSEVRKEIALIPSKPTNHNSCHVFNNPHVNCHVYEGSQHPHKLAQATMEQRANAETAFPRFHLHSPVENANLRGNYNCGITIASGSNGSYEDTSVAANAATAFENSHEDGFQQGNVRDGFQNSSGKDADSDRSRREAALTKFRLKRKDRCFEKKVRYHNRKRLAEQRPRLKGQFVRQAVAELNTIAAESDD